MGMFVRTMFWFTAEFWDPNSSEIVDVVIDLMAPEQTPRMLVLIYNPILLTLISKKKDTGMGIIISTIDAGLDK